MSAHLPRHVLEELATRRDADAQATALAHVEGCEACSSTLSVLQEARVRFAAAHPAAEHARQIIERAQHAKTARLMLRAPRMLGVAGAVIAAAAICVMWVAPSVPRDSHAIRLKATTSALEVYAKRGHDTMRVTDGEALRERDQLGFVTSLPSQRHVLILSLDDTGAISRYFPADDTRGIAAAGGRAQLSVAIELDAHRGQERIVALFSPQPIDERAARTALLAAYECTRTHPAAPLVLSKTLPLDLPVEQASLWFHKP